MRIVKMKCSQTHIYLGTSNVVQSRLGVAELDKYPTGPMARQPAALGPMLQSRRYTGPSSLLGIVSVGNHNLG